MKPILVGQTKTDPQAIGPDGEPITLRGSYTKIFPTVESWKTIMTLSERHADAMLNTSGFQSGIWVQTAELKPLPTIPFLRENP